MIGPVHTLIVEDEPRLASVLRRGLREDGIGADIAANGVDALRMAGGGGYDALVLDLMLPDIDGLELCRRMREREMRVPILILTARDSVEDRVRGLTLGADDYLPKPFSFPELVARLRALARRGPVTTEQVLTAGDLRLDPVSRRAWRGTAEIELSSREFALLAALIEHPGQVLDRIQLLDRAWDHGYERRSNIVDVYVRYLRQKVDRPFGLASIETVRGAGYRLRPDGGRAAG